MIRMVRKAVVLGLAVLGAQRLYELIAPRATQIKERVTPRVGEAVDMAKGTATGITDQVKRTATGVQEQVTDLAEQERKQAERIGAEVQSAVQSPGEPTGAPGRTDRAAGNGASTPDAPVGGGNTGGSTPRPAGGSLLG